MKIITKLWKNLLIFLMEEIYQMDKNWQVMDSNIIKQVKNSNYDHMLLFTTLI